MAARDGPAIRCATAGIPGDLHVQALQEGERLLDGLAEYGAAVQQFPRPEDVSRGRIPLAGPGGPPDDDVRGPGEVHRQRDPIDTAPRAARAWPRDTGEHAARRQ